MIHGNRSGHQFDCVIVPSRGIENLRVIDASIFPTVPSGNTNAPAMMVGEKGSDLVLGRPPLLPVAATRETPKAR